MKMKAPMRFRRVAGRARGPARLAVAVICVALVAGTASATQPPPPVTCELDVTRTGGDGNCKFSVDPPNPGTWYVDYFNEEYPYGTEIEVDYITICPTEFEFHRWTSNNSDINGNRGNRDSTFTITKDTWVMANFVPYSAKASGFTVGQVTQNTQTGDVSIKLHWSSTSGSLADLSGQHVFEVLGFDTQQQFDPQVREFLCTGLQSTPETIVLSSPWDWLGPLPKLTKTGGLIPAQNGTLTDTLTRQAFPPACSGQCSYTTLQWAIAGGPARCYLLNGPNAIVRSFSYLNGGWQYCISSHNLMLPCVPKTW